MKQEIKFTVFFRTMMFLSFVALMCLAPQHADAQLFNMLNKGANALKNSNAKKKFEPLKEKAENALQTGDMAYLISEECMVALPEQGNKMSGNALSEWQQLDKKIKSYLYSELHTIDQNNYFENVDAMVDKASSAPTTELKALYVDAAIGVMKAMIAYNFDVQNNRDKVDLAYNKVKEVYDQLPSTYKPYNVAKNADIKDPRYLHNLKGGIPTADFMIEYQQKMQAQKVEAAAKREAANAAELQNRKAMFAKGNNSSMQFYVSVKKPGTANLERIDIANIASGSTTCYINEKGGLSSIGKFVKEGNEIKVYKGSSLIGYITEDCQFFDYNRSNLGTLKADGKAYDRNGYTIGEVSSNSVKFGSSTYVWNCTSSIGNKLYPAALFLFFNKQFANYINVKDYYAH